MHVFSAQAFEQAFETQSITHFFQPIVHLSSQNIIGFEALARWQHAEHGLLSSSQFIYQLVEHGFAHRMTDLALRLSCDLIRQMQANGAEAVPIAVNLTATEFEDTHLIPRLQQQVDASVLGKKLLKFEMLEWGKANDLAHVSQVVQQLSELGIAVYADDFGHAYGSFNRLLNVPYAGIKLDSEYVNALGDKPRAAAILESLVKLCGDLKLQFVVEGVQTELQAQALKTMGVQSVQGFLYGRPMPAAQALALLMHNQAASIHSY